MSEYQYYEFAAIDGAISDEGMRYAQRCSSRASVSRLRWQNTYTFGDFHGSVDTLLKYYDAHFYIANWGTVRLGLALSKGAIDPEAIQSYFRGGERYEDTLTVTEVGNRCIVWWERNEEGGWGWTEGEGCIDQLIGVREELLRGDYRALFLGWLADFDPDEWRDPEDGSVVMPPIPAGLDHLSPALAALIEHFPVDRDALAVAAGLSRASTPNRVPIAEVLERLSVSEMRALLARVAEGGGSGVMTDLNRLTYPQIPVGQAMRCTDFAAKTIETREVRNKKAAGAAAARRQREAELRKQHLASIMQRADQYGPDSTFSWIRKLLRPTTRRRPNCRIYATPMHRLVTSAASSRSSTDFDFGTQIARLCCAGSINCDNEVPPPLRPTLLLSRRSVMVAATNSQ